MPESALDPLVDLLICILWLAFAYWVLIWGLDWAAERSKHQHTEEELRQLRREGYIKWWIMAAIYAAIGARAAIRLLEALGR